MKRVVLIAGGFVAVGVGFLGILLPLLPTTPFLLLAAGLFARSSPRLEEQLLDHPRLGTSLRAWRENGAISPSSKRAALMLIGVSYGFLLLTSRPTLLIAAAVGVLLAVCSIFIVTRPHPPGGTDRSTHQDAFANLLDNLLSSAFALPDTAVFTDLFETSRSHQTLAASILRPGAAHAAPTR